MRMKPANIMWGSAFLIIGFCYLTGAVFGWHFNLWNWWPLIILIPSVLGLLSSGPKLSPLIGCFIGGGFLLMSLNIVSGQALQKLFVPIILILIGISFLFKDFTQKAYIPKEVTQKYSTESAPEYSAIFGSRQVIYPNEVFRGTSINSIFGYVELNLRNAIITEDVVVNCTTIFAGSDIIIPANVNVKVSSVPIFGGVSNKTGTYNDPEAPTIFINATCMFGGVDIK